MPLTVDLNSDLGESYGRWTLGDDAALLDLITSANVACGAHAGDPTTMRRTCEAAAARGVAVGAHVAYRDLAGFGRRYVDVDPEALGDDLVVQIGGLAAVARSAGTRVTHVKPHGALYHAIATDEGQAGAVVGALRRVDPGLVLLGAPGSVVIAQAQRAGLPVAVEAFADRAYRADGALVPRGRPGAVLRDPGQAARQAVAIVVRGTVEADDGSAVAVRANSVCVHGDSPVAVEIARAVRAALEEAGVTVAAFAGTGGPGAAPAPGAPSPGD